MPQLRQLACVDGFCYCDAIRHPGIGRKQSVKASGRVDATIPMRDLDREIAWAVHDYAITTHRSYGTLIAV